MSLLTLVFLCTDSTPAPKKPSSGNSGRIGFHFAILKACRELKAKLEPGLTCLHVGKVT